MTPTTLIEIICKCGTSMTYRRQLIFDNKDGVIRCIDCDELLPASDILIREKNGIANMAVSE